MTNTTQRKIRIVVGEVSVEAVLLTTSTADAIWKALPLESICNIWGDEIYFTIPLSHNLEPNARECLEKGELGYWPQGPAFCIFFGPTPISEGDEIRAASAVNVFGKVIGECTPFKQARPNAMVRVEKAAL